MKRPATPGQIGLKVRDLRKKRRMTLHELAAEVGTTYSYLKRMERGLVKPYPWNRMKLAQVVAKMAILFEVKPDHILMVPE